MPPADLKSVVTVRVSEAMKAGLQRAADKKGGNLSAEILHRLAEYESLRRFVDEILDDTATSAFAVKLGELRRHARMYAPDAQFNDDWGALARALITAKCTSRLFQTVANHAAETLSEITRSLVKTAINSQGKTTPFFLDAEAMAEKIEAMAEEIVAEVMTNLTDSADRKAEEMALAAGPVIGPEIWNICFEKANALRVDLNEPAVKLKEVLPPTFTSLLSEDDMPAKLAHAFKTSKSLRNAAKRALSEGQFSGKSEDEVVDILYDDLLKPFGMEPSEAASDATAS